MTKVEIQAEIKRSAIKLAERDKGANIMTEEEILRKALDKWGNKLQLTKTAEEMSEVIQVICKMLLHKHEDLLDVSPESNAAFAEEIADVEIMLAQVRLMEWEGTPLGYFIDFAKTQKMTRLERLVRDSKIVKETEVMSRCGFEVGDWVLVRQGCDSYLPVPPGSCGVIKEFGIDYRDMSLRVKVDFRHTTNLLKDQTQTDCVISARDLILIGRP